MLYHQGMDDETADIRRRIAEARGVQKRLTQMQQRIRQQHDRLEHVIRGFETGGVMDEFRPPRPSSESGRAR